MAHITGLYAAMLTRDSNDSGTDSSVELIANFNGVDILHHTFPQSQQQVNQEQGLANLFHIPVIARDEVDTNLLDRAYFRVGLRGDDAWRPHQFALWCTAEGRVPVVPISAHADMHAPQMQRRTPPVLEPERKAILSTDTSEGDTSFALRRVMAGSRSMSIRGLMVAMDTHNWHSYGTDSPVMLRITAGGQIVFDYEFADTSQDEQDQGQANLYFLPVDIPFTMAQLLAGGNVRLSIGGRDNWLPTRFFIFGMDVASGDPGALVPLVHIGNWTQGELDTDSQQFVNLPLAQ